MLGKSYSYDAVSYVMLCRSRFSLYLCKDDAEKHSRALSPLFPVYLPSPDTHAVCASDRVNNCGVACATRPDGALEISSGQVEVLKPLKIDVKRCGPNGEPRIQIGCNCAWSPSDLQP